MVKRETTVEIFMFALALSLAIVLRLLNLGASPLTETEASWALQALQVARPQMGAWQPTPTSQPAYVILTGLLFTLLGSSNFLARLLPALAGSALVLLPALLRHRLGRVGALLMAYGLALDPSLVAVSRQAGGPMMAVSLSLLAAGFWTQRKPILAGICGGLALLSGPAVITGALILLLAGLITRYGRRIFDVGEVSHSRGELQSLLVSGLVTFLLISTGFFRYPQGLAAGFYALPAYLNGWSNPSGVSGLLTCVALIVYQPLALAFGLLGVIRWWAAAMSKTGERAPRLLLPLLWAVVSLLLVLIYPNRQVADITWAVLPLWAMGALEMEKFLPKKNPHIISIVQAGVIFILAGLLWITLLAKNQNIVMPELPEGYQNLLRVIILVGILGLGALTTMLVNLGWGWEIGRNGLAWGAAMVFIVHLVSAMWGASQMRPNQPEELWSPPPGTGQAELFMTTLKDLSNWVEGDPSYVDVVCVVDAPSLRWILRDYPNARFVSHLSSSDLPHIVITHQEGGAPELTAAYRGQDFIWWTRPNWVGALPPHFLDWLTFRKAPILTEKIILWARSDAFPGGTVEMPAAP